MKGNDGVWKIFWTFLVEEYCVVKRRVNRGKRECILSMSVYHSLFEEKERVETIVGHVWISYKGKWMNENNCVLKKMFLCLSVKCGLKKSCVVIPLAGAPLMTSPTLFLSVPFFSCSSILSAPMNPPSCLHFFGIAQVSPASTRVMSCSRSFP